ncbi:MAG: hypothetical protein PWP57_186 [Candidatus Atribacteria bacterium]|nr:hypothetical protein [Candidatus Atribacteria bacterium]
MPFIEIKPGIYWVGVNDHTTDLFEGLWPIDEEGVSYNSYLIKDEKVALVDLAKSLKVDEFLSHIGELVDFSHIDYIILNHLEPDHTGVLNILWKLSPQATIVCSPLAREMVSSFYGIKERVRVVGDGEEISLGEKTLKFFSTPMVHWPETMMTYEVNSQVLFSCDAFGGYGSLQGAIFDDECSDFDFYKRESLRYYVNIVAKFSPMVIKAIDKLSSLALNLVAPSHGLIWRKNPSLIINLYRQWASYAETGGEKGIALVYGSMYGNTETMMDAIARGVAESGIGVEIFDVRRTNPSYILPSLWVNKGVIIGAPTYETGLFPLMAHLLDLAVRKGIKNKKTLYFGSYGWSGGGRREWEKLVSPLNWEIVNSVEFKGGFNSEILTQGRDLGREFGKVIKNL